MTSALRRAQAEHFDSHSPFTPASRALRIAGFKYSLILKDLRISQVLQRHSPKPGFRLLDVGCGSGIFLDRSAVSYKSLGYGVDISRVSLKRLQSESAHVQRAACAEGESLPFRDASFDMVVTFDVLEHVDSLEKVLSEMLRVLKPEGKIICYAVSRRNRFTLNWFLATLLDALRVNHWAWAGHAPERLVDPERATNAVQQLGGRIQLLEPFHAFFTILFDQSILVLYRLAMLLNGSGQSGNADSRLPAGILPLTTALCRILLRPLVRLDSPWASRGLSNGFMLVATRPSPSA